ncbi:hypothetical protein [Oceanobacillus iheyensis HTE831]|uniref:Uncharacterized protein n=1 Tax=Oceanobacillus iheyensis (strain DSM 14371 / CIP 107618 / JCM 11309 / KCTC 3954 / HTE831) TaxID=221109 RepID=Q8EL93_OCEIH|nr:hypothetical protein [Oceanobacillus iheyensis]BAC15294.1 hypothetical protein [Oceanobacillus iheyensis HTE831]
MVNMLVQRLDDKLFKQLGYSYVEKEFYYYFESEKVLLENSQDEFNDEINKQEFLFSGDPQWNPEIHHLMMDYTIVLNNPMFLFGAEGLTHEQNNLGLAIVLKSRDSSYTKVKKIGSIQREEEQQSFSINLDFEPASLRGTIEFNIVIYLEKAIDRSNLLQINEEGAILGELERFYVHLDGDGAEFPMQEFEDKDGPLWKTSIYVDDPFMDLFTLDHFCLHINKAHKRYREINPGYKVSFNRLLIEIISSAFEQLIYYLKYELNMLNDILTKESDSGTIASVIKYYFDTYEWDSSNIDQLSAMVRESFESRVS